MKKIILADTHKFSLHVLDVNCFPVFSGNVYLIGDIVDMKNCKKKEVGLAKRYVNSLRMVYGKRYVSGNHECGFWNYMYIERDGIPSITPHPTLATPEGIMYIHGDMILDLKKWTKARKRKPGASWWKRLSVGFGGFVRGLGGEKKWSQSRLKKVSAYGKRYRCHTVVMGHMHPARVLDETYNGVRCIAVPRGRTELEL